LKFLRMWINSKLIISILQNNKLKKNLLRSKEVSEDEYKSFDSLPYEKRALAEEHLIETLKAFSPFIVSYPSPIEQYPDDANIYGTRGAYMVTTQDGTVFFHLKRAAIQYASDISKVSWEIARSEGFLD
jgi:hypothetical protein